MWFLTTGKKANITLIFGDDRKEDSGSSKLVSLAQVSRKIAEPAISKQIGNKKVNGNSQNGLWMGKSYLMN